MQSNNSDLDKLKALQCGHSMTMWTIGKEKADSEILIRLRNKIGALSVSNEYLLNCYRRVYMDELNDQFNSVKSCVDEKSEEVRKIHLELPNYWEVDEEYFETRKCFHDRVEVSKLFRVKTKIV